MLHACRYRLQEVIIEYHFFFLVHSTSTSIESHIVSEYLCEVIEVVLLALLHLSQVVQVLVVLLENWYHLFNVFKGNARTEMKRFYHLLRDEFVDGLDASEILKVEIFDRMIPSESIRHVQLEVLTQNASSKVFNWVHLKCDALHLSQFLELLGQVKDGGEDGLSYVEKRPVLLLKRRIH